LIPLLPSTLMLRVRYLSCYFGYIFVLLCASVLLWLLLCSCYRLYIPIKISADETNQDKFIHVGIETMDERWVERNRLVPHFHAEPENCPFPWARRSPENLLRQETYLTLATVFVLLRLLHLISPTMVVFVKFTWGRVSNMRLGNPLEHTVTMYLKEPCMSSNLQEGAMNARAWASKSLATVSIAESSSSSRSVSASQ